MRNDDRVDAWAHSMFGSDGWDQADRKRFWKKIVATFVTATGLFFLLSQWSMFWISIKPAYDVEYLLENGAKEGMHVSGEVTYTYDCFANMENFDNKYVSAYYYALPAANGMMILSMPPKKQKEMEKLLDETMEYLDGGSWPVSSVPIEGYVTKAEGRLPYLLSQYMLEIGYTQEEVDSMGQPMMIQYYAEKMKEARIYTPIGVIILALEVLFTVIPMMIRKFRRSN